jgi:hypothetical protein
LLASLTVLALLWGFSLLAPVWGVRDVILQAFSAGKAGGLRSLTGGRMGSDGVMRTMFGDVWSESPIYGRGGGSAACVDSAYFSIFNDSGLLGLVAYALILGILFLHALRLRSCTELRNESQLMIMLVLLIVLGGFGVPCLELNRVASVIWVLLGILLNDGALASERMHLRNQLCSDASTSR